MFPVSFPNLKMNSLNKNALHGSVLFVSRKSEKIHKCSFYLKISAGYRVLICTYWCIRLSERVPPWQNRNNQLHACAKTFRWLSFQCEIFFIYIYYLMVHCFSKSKFNVFKILKRPHFLLFHNLEGKMQISYKYSF